jgi:large conductance mechanosensitive channel
MIQEFKDFIARGNVIDLAVAVVIGAAFTAVVTTFANGILMQIIAALFNQPDFSTLSITLRDTEIVYGAFINAVINFLIVAVAMFLVVKGVNSLQNFRKRPTEEIVDQQETEIELLMQIRDALNRKA